MIALWTKSVRTLESIPSIIGHVKSDEKPGRPLSKPQHLTRVIIKVDERDFVLNVTEIDWIEAEGNYVRLHFGGQSSLIRETLSHLASQLDPTQFARIHRSRLVNLNRILS